MLASRSQGIQQRCPTAGLCLERFRHLPGQQFRPFTQLRPQQTAPAHPVQLSQLLHAAQAATRHVHRAAAAGAAVATASPGSSSSGTKSELHDLIHSVPYKRLLLWACVGAVCWQMHEFFGVSIWFVNLSVVVLLHCGAFMHSCTRSHGG